MRVEKVCGLSLDSLFREFNPQIVKLKGLGMTHNDIRSDIYTTILTCSKNFNREKSKSFMKYVRNSIKNNLKVKINRLARQNFMEVELDSSHQIKMGPNLEIGTHAEFILSLDDLPKVREFSRHF
jgi:hypothetical protein